MTYHDRSSKCNIPAAALRWSIERAVIEFGLATATLRKALAEESIVCGSDDCFSTREICRGVFGSLSEEKLQTQRQLTRKYELENQITEASVLNRAELKKSFAALANALGQAITNSDLPRTAKENF